jgi:hypothetical protein
LAAQDKWATVASRIAFHNLEDNSRIETLRDEYGLNAARLKIEKVAADIIAGKFPAKPGFQCGSCPYRNLCPATERNIAPVKAISAARA